MKNLSCYIGRLLIVFFILPLAAKAQNIIPIEAPVSYDVNSTGGFTYSLPIEVPPGIKGMVPSLAITYNSQAGNSNLGIGWSLSGASAITRTAFTIFHDQALDAVNFYTDGFALDGQRLISTGTGIYMTEIKNFAKIQSYGTAGNGPSYFKNIPMAWYMNTAIQIAQKCLRKANLMC
jgi:hypothetical protein